jgi:hypothetical protein
VTEKINDMISEKQKVLIINRLVEEYDSVSTKGEYYNYKNKVELKNKLQKCDGVYEMACVYQPFTGCMMSKIIDDLILPTILNERIF